MAIQDLTATGSPVAGWNLSEACPRCGAVSWAVTDDGDECTRCGFVDGAEESVPQGEVPAIPLAEALRPFEEKRAARKTEPVTRNVQLVELTRVAHEFLASQEQLAELPQLAAVALDPHPLPGPDCAEIEFHLIGTGKCQHVALWARHLATTVRVLDRKRFVSCWAQTSVRGHSLRVWTHISREQAAEILEPAGQVLGTHVSEVAAALVLEVLSTEGGA